MEDKIAITVKWARDYITDYQKNGCYFDPFKALTGTEDKQQRMFGECVNFLSEVENLIEQFDKTRNKIIFSQEVKA